MGEIKRRTVMAIKLGEGRKKERKKDHGSWPRKRDSQFKFGRESIPGFSSLSFIFKHQVSFLRVWSNLLNAHLTTAVFPKRKLRSQRYFL